MVACSLSIAPIASSSVDLADQRTKRAAHAIGDDDLAILVETVGSHALQAIGMLRALRRDKAASAEDLPFAGPPLDIGEEERTLVVTSAKDPSQKGA
jgi:hypothetical protein